MKKAAKRLSLVLIGASFWAAFFIPLAFAQTPSGILIVGQGQLNNSSTVNNGAYITYSVFLGKGYVGPISQLVLSLSNPVITGSPSGSQITAFVQEASTTNSVVDDAECDFTTGYPLTIVNGFTLMATSTEVNHGCTLNPSMYLSVRFDVNVVNNNNQVHWTSINGSNTNFKGFNVSRSWGPGLDCSQDVSNPCETDFIPYFALTGNGFILDVVPTASSSALSLSGAQVFCNAQFGTSSSIASDFGSAICTAVGFLFIPSQASVQQFSGVSDALSGKIPFSYFYDFSTLLGGSSASSTANFSVLSVDLRSTGVGSTTPWGNVLPSSFTYLASTTIGTYIPSGLYDTLFLLMRSAIWIVVLFHIYHRLRPKNATSV